MTVLRRFALILAGIQLLCAGTFGQEESTRARLQRWSWPVTAEHLAIATVLRESRKADGPPAAELVGRIAGEGTKALEAEIDILVRRRVPEVGPEDRPQLLSEPQRELILAAIASLPLAAIREGMEAQLERDPTGVGSRLAAIHLLRAVGDANDLARLVELAPRGPGQETSLLPEAREAVSSSCAAILRRDAGAWPTLGAMFRKVDPDSGMALLGGLGSAKDPRALELLHRAAQSHRELRPQAIALVASCGRSPDARIDAELTTWMVSELPTARPEYARSLLQGLGALDDGTCAAAMIDRLEDKDAGVQDCAVRALQRVSGLGFPADVKPWLAWHHEEIAWHANKRRRVREDLASTDPSRVVAALRSYSEHRSRRAELALEVATVLACPRPELRRLACEVLQTLGSLSVAGDLARALLDPDRKVAEAAWQALKTITGIDLPRDPDKVREILGVS